MNIITLQDLTPEKGSGVLYKKKWAVIGFNLILLLAFIYSSYIIISSRKPILNIIEDNRIVELDLTKGR